MPKLNFDDGSSIDITDKQAQALEYVFPKMKPDASITINGASYLRSTILGVTVKDIPKQPLPEFGTKLPKEPKVRKVEQIPRGVVLPERLQSMFEAGQNIDWYFTKRKK